MQSGKSQVQEVRGHVVEDQKQVGEEIIPDQSTRSFTIVID